MAALVMLALLTALPSALNLPQSTPTETVEYAPVPPDEDSPPPPPSGNFSSLGLGSSSGVAAGKSESPNELPPIEGNGRQVKVPGTKRCVGTPPRQTEDPLAPPCVGFYEGDNGGATYQGVTGDEIRVIIISTGYNSNGNYKGANEASPVRQYYDLAKPPKEDDHSSTRYLRAWQQYFNERYQTYGRFVHFYVYYPGNTRTTPEERRADAIDNYNTVKPFAVVWPNQAANIPVYNEVMAKKGVLTFNGLFGLRSEIFSKYPKLSWGFMPSLEEHATSFSAFVCEKVAPHPVEFSGNVGENGQRRKYGLIYSVATSAPYAKDFANLVKPMLAKCGVAFALERTHDTAATFHAGKNPNYAPEAMAAFQRAGVTTVLWLLGFETNYSKAAAAINYRPEWILAGDGTSEGVWNGQYQEQSVWDEHAVTFSLLAKTAFGGVSEPCRDAYLQVDPEIPRGTLDLAITCFFYDELRQLFTGIQVAGAKLNPDTMDKGYHAIPAIPSKDPTVPACYYGPGDYTCVKDGTLMWYDADHQDEATANTKGCWRLMDGGTRHIPDEWPKGNVGATKKTSDPCNGWLGSLTYSTS
jgi:hypothetical protein